jgi:hypothetical protein
VTGDCTVANEEFWLENTVDSGHLSELVKVRNNLSNPTVTLYPIKVSGDPKKEPKEFIITVCEISVQNSVKVILRKMLEILKSLRSYMTYTVYDLRRVRKGLNIFVQTRRPPDKKYKEYLDLLLWSVILLQKNAPRVGGTFKINNADGILSFEVSDSYVVNCTGKAC